MLLAGFCILLFLPFIFSVQSSNQLDNGLVGKVTVDTYSFLEVRESSLSLGEPVVDCMEDHVKLTFKTAKPFNGRIFVKGMIDNDNCVTNYPKNLNNSVEFNLQNGECNMRRSRKVSFTIKLIYSILITYFYANFTIANSYCNRLQE